MDIWISLKIGIKQGLQSLMKEQWFQVVNNSQGSHGIVGIVDTGGQLYPEILH